MPTFGERVKRSWNAFMGRDPTYHSSMYGDVSRPDRIRISVANARTIVNSIYNRIAVDCAQIDIKHVRLDKVQDRYKETIKSSLNECLSLNANVDQTGRSMIQDGVMSMFDEGCVAFVPTDTEDDPNFTDSYLIEKIRIGKIIGWFPDSVRIELYNEATGKKQQVKLLKRYVAIVENPFYSIMNEPNSTQKRLIRVLNQIDRMNENTCSGKLDLIITLPYAAKTPAKQEMAENRRRSLEDQISNSKLGVGYIDATERVTQLNRSLENNLWSQAKDLTSELFNQLGLTEAIFNGTADETAYLNYYNHTIEPILSAITMEMERKWISRTARTQLQAIRFFRDPFKLVPVNSLAEMVDKFTRNEIMTSNEIRSIMGLIPSDDPKADKLINSNLNQSNEEAPESFETTENSGDEETI